VEVTVACDVKNPLCGENGASYVFGPQKGADPETVKALDAALTNYGEKLKELLGRDVANIPGAGAAGGMGAGLIAFCGGVLKPGIDEITSALDLESHMQWADLAITGEGQIDRTSAMGKVLSGVGRLGIKYQKPVIAFGGGIGDGAEAVYEAGITAFTTITHKPMELSYALENAETLIEAAAERTARLIKVGTIL
jgi:glycerate kinase